MSDFSDVNMLDGITEKEWLELRNKVKGVVLYPENADEKNLIEQGYTCLTENTIIDGGKMWVRPDGWKPLLQSVKIIKNKKEKQSLKIEWMQKVKEKLNVKNINETSKTFDFEFSKSWVIKLDHLNLVVKTIFTIKEKDKNIQKWIKEYDRSDDSIMRFSEFLAPDKKWESVFALWQKDVKPKWESIVERLNESSKEQWYSWMRKSWNQIVYDNTPQDVIQLMLNDLSKMQMQYERERESLKKRIEILHAENLVNFDKFEDHFFSARSIDRKITFFEGPPNTGKTFNSFNQLQAGESGAYWAPLRLLAVEGLETMLERGVLCNLITGEERKYSKGCNHVASTIEMANLRSPIDVAIIDEIQLLTDKERGWAFTQAYLGAPAKHLVLTGAAQAIPYLDNMSKYLGEPYGITELRADKELKIERSIGQNFSMLKEGDAMIAFSRTDVLSWKTALEKKGFSVSCIYGHLSPQVRREEARKFREGETQILVSTDAIGLGLNMPIKRVIFTTLSKFDGTIDRILLPSEAWQIANRAGRKGWVENGSVTTWFSEHEDTLIMLMNSKDETPKDFKWWVQPLPEQIELWNKKIGGTLPQILEVFSNKLLQGHPVFKACAMDAAIARADKIKHFKLRIDDLYSYATAPVDKEDLESEMKLIEWAYMHSNGKKIKWSDVKHLWREKTSYHSKAEALLDVEKKVRLLTVYRWLTLRFPDIYYGNKEAVEEHFYLNMRIEKYLLEIVKKKENDGKGKGMYREYKNTFI